MRKKTRPFGALIDTALLAKYGKLTPSALCLLMDLYAGSAANNTDGRVTLTEVEAFSTRDRPRRAALPALVKAGALVEDGEDRWKLTDWDDTQPSSADREKASDRANKRFKNKPKPTPTQAKTSKPAEPLIESTYENAWDVIDFKDARGDAVDLRLLPDHWARHKRGENPALYAMARELMEWMGQAAARELGDCVAVATALPNGSVRVEPKNGYCSYDPDDVALCINACKQRILEAIETGTYVSRLEERTMT